MHTQAFARQTARLYESAPDGLCSRAVSHRRPLNEPDGLVVMILHFGQESRVRFPVHTILYEILFSGAFVHKRERPAEFGERGKFSVFCVIFVTDGTRVDANQKNALVPRTKSSLKKPCFKLFPRSFWKQTRVGLLDEVCA